MTLTLEPLIEKARRRLDIVSRQIEELPAGRGGEWKALLQHVHREFEGDLDASEKRLDAARAVSEEALSQTRTNITQHLERVQMLLDGLHIQMATYRSAVARSDVPVGLQHLIDVLMEEIVIGGGDPMVHLDELNMYSTVNLTTRVNLLIDGLGPQASAYVGRDPIAFNLPGLDPNNVLLAPVLAHEVAHTAVNQQLLDALHAQFNGLGYIDDIEEALDRYQSASDDAGEVDPVIERFANWSQELLCDAIAVAVSGPSFLFAITAFVTPPSTAEALSAHPPVHDRIRYALDLAEELGWADFMREKVPNVTAWLRAIADTPLLEGTSEEAVLREMTEKTRDARRLVALAHIRSHFVPTGADDADRIDTAAGWLAQGVPMIDMEGRALSPWQAILAGWMAAFTVNGDDAVSIATAAGDSDYNAVIVKALEYSQIVSAWRAA